MSGQPFPKERQLERGRKRYRRKVAPRKQWEALTAVKARTCRVGDCYDNRSNCHGLIDPHHIVFREDGGDDVEENVVGLCRKHHDLIHGRDVETCRTFVSELWADEYAYAVQRGGSDYFERAYGITYERGGRGE